MKTYLFIITLLVTISCSEKEQKETKSQVNKTTKLSTSDLQKSISNYEDTLILLSKKNEIQNIH